MVLSTELENRKLTSGARSLRQSKSSGIRMPVKEGVNECQVLLILGDPGAVSQAGEKARRKFSSTGGKAPELPTLTGPFPNDQANVGS